MTHRIRYALALPLLLAAGAANAAPGDSDPGFARDGRLRVGFGAGQSAAIAATQQPDGKVILVGTAENGDANEVALVRYTTSGTLDPTFGIGGVTRKPYSITPATGDSPYDQASAVAMYDATRFVVASYGGATSSAYNFVVTRFKGNGTPDSTFGVNGVVVTDVSGDSDRPSGIAVQADGKIVVVGTVGPPSASNVGVVRYTANGVLDAMFDGDGIATYSFSAASDQANGVAIQPDGKIVVAGQVLAGGDLDVLVLRYLTNGTLDPAFSGDGVVTTDLPNPSAEYGGGVAIQTGVSQPIPKIVVAGGSQGALLVLRYLDNGTLDATFNGVGYRTISFGSHAQGYGAVVQALSGDPARILISGWGQLNSENNFLVARMFLDGAPDNAFDTDGLAATPLAAGYTFSMQLVSGKILLAGQSLAPSGGYRFTSARFDGTGALDPSWDGDGLRFDALGDGPCSPRDVAIQSDGKIVAVGAARESPVEQLGFGVIRLLRDGTLDPSFGVNGRVITHPGGPSVESEATAVAIQPDERIVVAGVEGSGENVRILVTRLLPNGDPDPSFDGDGVQDGFFAFGPWNYATSVRIEPGGRIVLGGWATDLRDHDFLVLRLTPYGALDTSFDGDGGQTIDFGSVYDDARAIAVQPDGKIVLAGSMHNGVDTDFAVARVLANGGIDYSFHTIGRLTTHVAAFDEAYDVAVMPDGRIVVAGQTGQTSSALALARYLPSGALDTSFDGDGIALPSIFEAPGRRPGPDAAASAAPQSAYGRDLVVLPNEKLLLAGYVDSGSGTEDFVVVRIGTDGRTDQDYGEFAGYQLVNLDRGYPDVEPSAALDDSGRIVLVGDSDGLFGFTRLLGDPPGVVAAEETPVAGARLALAGANPFRSRATLVVELPEAAEVGLDVYDVAGARVRSLAEGARDPGRHRYVWDGADDAGRTLGAGVYFARLHLAAQTFVTKLVKLD